MKNNIIACAVMLFVLFGWTLFHAVSSNVGEIVEIKVSGYDPRDLISGHYLTYNVNYDNFKPSACRNFYHGSAVYLCLERAKLSASKPAGCLAIKGNCKGHGANIFTAGIERFYVPETYAQSLDAALRGGKHEAKIKVLITRGGTAYVKDMLFDGVSAKEFATRGGK
jgi:uncharacterized membrane-anchored protein